MLSNAVMTVSVAFCLAFELDRGFCRFIVETRAALHFQLWL